MGKAAAEDESHQHMRATCCHVDNGHGTLSTSAGDTKRLDSQLTKAAKQAHGQSAVGAPNSSSIDDNEQQRERRQPRLERLKIVRVRWKHKEEQQPTVLREGTEQATQQMAETVSAHQQCLQRQHTTTNNAPAALMISTGSQAGGGEAGAHRHAHAPRCTEPAVSGHA